MQYLLLIYNNEQNWTTLNETDRKALSAEYGSFTEAIAKEFAQRRVAQEWRLLLCAARTTFGADRHAL